MENQQQSGITQLHTDEFLKKRKFYLAIPILILPFMTMAFWALGGGKDAGKAATKIPDKGIDLVLPSAQFKDKKDKDKMDIYQAAGKDTAKTQDGVSKSFIRQMGFNPQTTLAKARPDQQADQSATDASLFSSSPSPGPGSEKAEQDDENNELRQCRRS